jgi:hypothetical protein
MLTGPLLRLLHQIVLARDGVAIDVAISVEDADALSSPAVVVVVAEQ